MAPVHVPSWRRARRTADALLLHHDVWAADKDRVGALFSANDPDLSGKRSRGAKLLMWNGTTDTSVSPKDNVR
jgi:hypothetical protein